MSRTLDWRKLQPQLSTSWLLTAFAERSAMPAAESENQLARQCRTSQLPVKYYYCNWWVWYMNSTDLLRVLAYVLSYRRACISLVGYTSVHMEDEMRWFERVNWLYRPRVFRPPTNSRLSALEIPNGLHHGVAFWLFPEWFEVLTLLLIVERKWDGRTIRF